MFATQLAHDEDDDDDDDDGDVIYVISHKSRAATTKYRLILVNV